MGKIKEAWQNAMTWFDEKVVTPIRNFFTENWTKIKDKVEEVWEKSKKHGKMPRHGLMKNTTTD